MKRNKILLVSSALLLLTGCNSGNQLRGKQAFPRNGESDHVTYLVLSAVGQYQGATIVDKDDNLFLERFVKFNGAANSDLPGEDVITASSGAKFAGWVSYEGTGALSFYEKVPEENGKILYAYFSGTAVTPTPGPGPTPPGPTGDTMEITVTGAPDWITNDGCVIFAWAWGGTGAAKDGAWYACQYGEGAKPTSFSFTVPSDNTGCLLARCAQGTTTPDWNATSGAGAVYNKSKDINFTSGTTSYTSPTWQEKKNGQWVDCN